ncbi:hypothetical protein ANANG_G00259930 [Anguilla anguilla]|uniref:WH2 domain-containing protein n=1 Tax=Anguilla anguilla TaxID=7936 RepID=A0A9D3RL82_ANGAN|nr:hypothetical protein ANANG_G00259930 [Anguilla anguilla]
MDIEVLDPTVIKGENRSPEVESADSEDMESGVREHCSWAGLFSFQDMRAVHLQLCSVNSDLEPCLPPFPEEPLGMWTVLFGPPEVTEKETDILCYQLQVYLGHALDTCGWKILSQVLFTESDDPEEYYESLSELRQKGYEEVLQRAKKRLHELLEKHKAVESMVELLELYQEEDEAYGELAEATTQLYQYLLQPFRDMRELAMLRRQQIKISMETDYLGPRRIEALQREDADWQRKAQAAVLNIQELTVKYFEITARAQKAHVTPAHASQWSDERMRADQKKFGKAAWAAAVERMEKLQYSVSKETLQLMRAKEICLEQRKHALREEMQGLQVGEDAMARLDQLEELYYELQLQLYEIQFEILKYEELLLTAQLESIKRQVTERQDEVVYYDTYESMDAMQATADAAASVLLRQEELGKLQQRVRQLEARRGRITAKKAYLRNKKEICIFNHNEKVQQRQGSQEDQKSHHAMQQQREQQEEEKRSTLVSQERQKTLDRLRSFKQRYPGQVVLKSTRLRLGYARRKGGSASAPGVALDQPRSLEAGTLAEECGAAPAETSQRSAFPRRPRLRPASSASPPPPLRPGPEDAREGPRLPGSPARQLKVEGGEAGGEAIPLGPFSGRFFDSSQLVNARKKLKKTAALEASQRRRASSPMDEVLASLKRGSFHLRKAELRVLRPDPDQDDSDNILAQIRKGVKLRKVQQQGLRDATGGPRDSADPLTRSIHEALRRIKEASPESEDEEDALPCADWES